MAEPHQLNPETTAGATPFTCLRRYKWWLQITTYTFFVLAGQSAGTLLGRLYFNNGGKSEWMATFVQTAGFPILLPFLWAQKSQPRSPVPPTLVYFYIVVGVFLAADCMMYSIGLQYLPVTTYTLICATQLGFNSIFSYFLNKQKFTPYIVNSVVLLTISSVLLVFQPDSGDSNKVSSKKFAVGFVCTLAASAGYALMLSLSQLAFQRIIKKETLRAVVEMAVYQNTVATAVILVGLFCSGDWKKMKGEMEGYRLGKVSYVMNLFWTAVSWQAFNVGALGLIFKVSSLFSNVISILGLPVAPVLAVFFLKDKLTGLKAVSMVLATWGFVSYMYQHYLDDLAKKEKEKNESSGKSDEEVAVEMVDESELSCKTISK